MTAGSFWSAVNEGVEIRPDGSPMLQVSCIFWPTAGESTTVGIDKLDHVAAGPTLDSMRSCGKWNFDR